MISPRALLPRLVAYWTMGIACLVVRMMGMSTLQEGYGDQGMPGVSIVRMLVSGWISGGAGMPTGNLERAHC